MFLSLTDWRCLNKLPEFPSRSRLVGSFWELKSAYLNIATVEKHWSKGNNKYIVQHIANHIASTVSTGRSKSTSWCFVDIQELALFTLILQFLTPFFRVDLICPWSFDLISWNFYSSTDLVIQGRELLIPFQDLYRLWSRWWPQWCNQSCSHFYMHFFNPRVQSFDCTIVTWHLDIFFWQCLVGTPTLCPQLFFLHCPQRCATTSSCSLPLSVCIDWNIPNLYSPCVTAIGTRISAIGKSPSLLTETCKWPFIF